MWKAKGATIIFCEMLRVNLHYFATDASKLNDNPEGYTCTPTYNVQL